MSLLRWPVDALAWLGRRGTSTLPLMAIIGIAVPVLGTLLKPFVALAVFLLLVLAFLRVDLAALRDHARRPMIVVRSRSGRCWFCRPARAGAITSLGIDVQFAGPHAGAGVASRHIADDVISGDSRDAGARRRARAPRDGRLHRARLLQRAALRAPFRWRRHADISRSRSVSNCPRCCSARR